MTDKELLGLAAKACGDGWAHLANYKDEWLDDPVCEAWNPLRFDGDALRLAVKLNILNTRANGYEWPEHDQFLRDGDNAEAATRRAIVRAAAEIGKAMSTTEEK